MNRIEVNNSNQVFVSPSKPKQGDGILSKSMKAVSLVFQKAATLFNAPKQNTSTEAIDEFFVIPSQNIEQVKVSLQSLKEEIRKSSLSCGHKNSQQKQEQFESYKNQIIRHLDSLPDLPEYDKYKPVLFEGLEQNKDIAKHNPVKALHLALINVTSALSKHQ